MAPSTVNGPRPFVRAKFDLVGDIGALKCQNVRSIPDLISFNSENNPSHTFCLQAEQSSEEGKFGFKSITFFELDLAVRRCCKWITTNIEGVAPAVLSDDGSVQKSRPVALLMESDINLFVFAAALLSMNVPCLLLSMRLTPEGIKNLIEVTHSAAIVTTSRSNVIAQAAFDGTDSLAPASTKICTAPQAQVFLDPSDSEDLGSFSTSDLVREDDRHVFILHSSGTTGLPKPIPLAHRNLLGYAACHRFPTDEDESIRGTNLSTLPLFHGFGFLGPCLALSVGKPICLPPPSIIPSGRTVISIIEQTNITSLMTVPMIVEDIISLENFSEAARTLATLEFVAVGGGGMKPSVGQALHKEGIALLNHFGATELGALAPIFRPGKDYDYRYLRIRSDMGLKLSILEPGPNGERLCKLTGYPFGWGCAFELQDQLEYNPLFPETEVKILGRNDDLIVLANGEKVLPNKFERILEQEPSIRRAVMFGQGQNETGILVEPAQDVAGDEELFIRGIWPAIQSANESIDGHGRISSKLAVLVKAPEKAIPLSDKGVPQRKNVYAAFEAEISELYERLGKEESAGGSFSLDFGDLRKSLRELIHTLLPTYRQATAWSDDDDLIHLGVDSLRATQLRRALDGALSTTLPSDFVYSHPSVDRLAAAIEAKSNGAEDCDAGETPQRLLSKFAFAVPAVGPRPLGSVILLTGSTGNLGANLLKTLAETRDVEQVVCLSRSKQAPAGSTQAEALRERQQAALQERGIALSEAAWAKVRFLAWEPGHAFLGLEPEVYRALCSRVTDIFHGAWPMDFKRQLASFAPHVQVVKDLVQFGRDVHAAQPAIRPRVVLASSIAAAGCYASGLKTNVVPETPLDDHAAALPMGYAKAKWVCEMVMQSAHQLLRAEIAPMIVRIGQLSGSRQTGYWSTQEHMAALVKASKTLGRMPNLTGSLSWIPVDLAAQTAADLLLTSSTERLVVHLENPVRQPWTDMCNVIEQHLGITEARMEYEAWLEAVFAGGHGVEELRPFFKDHFLRLSGGGLILDTVACQESSQTLRSVGPVEASTVRLYLDSWVRQGLLV